MDVLFEVSSERARSVLLPAARACARKSLTWSCFFTHHGVRNLADPELVTLLAEAQSAVACEHSWTNFMGRAECPVELGSQTDNSRLVAEAARVVSL
jgi:hypothetical protein